MCRRSCTVALAARGTVEAARGAVGRGAAARAPQSGRSASLVAALLHCSPGVLPATMRDGCNRVPFTMRPRAAAPNLAGSHQELSLVVMYTGHSLSTGHNCYEHGNLAAPEVHVMASEQVSKPFEGFRDSEMDITHTEYGALINGAHFGGIPPAPPPCPVPQLSLVAAALSPPEKAAGAISAGIRISAKSEAQSVVGLMLLFAFLDRIDDCIIAAARDVLKV